MSKALEGYFEVQRKVSQPLEESEEVILYTTEYSCDEYCDVCGVLVSISKAGARQIIDFVEGLQKAYDAVYAEDKELKVATYMSFSPHRFGVHATAFSAVNDDLVKDDVTIGLDYDAVVNDEESTEMRIDDLDLAFNVYSGHTAYLTLTEKYSDYKIEVPLQRDVLERVIAHTPDESSSPQCG